jgi:hypothetical protein
MALGSPGRRCSAPSRALTVTKLPLDVLVRIICLMVSWDFPPDSSVWLGWTHSCKTFKRAWDVSMRGAMRFNFCAKLPPKHDLAKLHNLQDLSLDSVDLPIGVVHVLREHRQLQTIAFTSCKVWLALADPSKAAGARRVVAFLDQFLEPLTLPGAKVRVRAPRLAFAAVPLPRAMCEPWSSRRAGTSLYLDVAADQDLGCLLHWAAQRQKLWFQSLTVVYRHEHAHSIVRHHGFHAELGPTFLHPSLFDRVQLPPTRPPRGSRHSIHSILAKMPCEELVLADALLGGGHLAQRLCRPQPGGAVEFFADLSNCRSQIELAMQLR